MNITKPRDMELNSVAEEIISKIELILIHQPKNLQSYNIQITGDYPEASMDEVENMYIKAGWITCSIFNISKNVNKVILNK